MSDKNKNIMKKLSNNIGSLSDLQKEYMLGYLEGVAQANKPKRKKNKNKQ